MSNFDDVLITSTTDQLTISEIDDKILQELIEELGSNVKDGVEALRVRDHFEGLYLDPPDPVFEAAGCVQRPQPDTIYYLKHHNQVSDKFYRRYSSRNCANRDQHWGRKELFHMVLNVAYHMNKSPQRNFEVMHIGESSYKVFSQTRCHSCHNNGTHIDIDFPGSLIADGGSYSNDDKIQSGLAILLAIHFGTLRCLYGDDDVVAAVNEVAKKRRYVGRARYEPSNHRDHIHLELPLP